MAWGATWWSVSWRIFHRAYFVVPLRREKKPSVFLQIFCGAKAHCVKTSGPQAPTVDKTKVYKQAWPGDQEVPSLSQMQVLLAHPRRCLQRFQRPWEAAPTEGGFRVERKCLSCLPPYLIGRQQLHQVSLGPPLGCLSPLCPQPIFMYLWLHWVFIVAHSLSLVVGGEILSLVAVQRFFMVVASLVVEHGL